MNSLRHKKNNRPSDNEIMRALIGQVMKATPKKRSELDVVTFITKPMWQAFCRASGTPVDAKPTEWLGAKSVRVFGSKTVVLNSKKLQSVSFSIVASKE